MAKAQKQAVNDNDFEGDEDVNEPHIGPDEAAYLKMVRKRLKKLDDDLVELREPVNKKQAEIAAVYAELRKKGYDSDVIKMQHKKGMKFDRNFTVRWNRYALATEIELPLFADVGSEEK
mgnify:CR=1 FL=1